jgi:hypothetical protein
MHDNRNAIDVGLSQLKEHKINWDSVREQTETFYYCLDEIHSSLLFVRVWAQSGVAEELDRADVQKRIDKLKTDVGIQASRLRALISTSNDKIEALRLRDRPQGFFQHQL